MTEFENNPLLSAPLPLVVQLGFAGSRKLFDVDTHPDIDVASFEAETEKWLADRLVKLRHDLHLQDHHFFCGISALAIGADMIFSRACRTATIPHRVFLPQTRDEFLNAQGTDGPDFPLPSQRDALRELLASSHVIQERVVSDAEDREDRFDDTNREIVRLADVLVCLVREDAAKSPAGTDGLIVRAVQRGKPVLVALVGVADGKPVMTEKWHLPHKDGKPLTDPAQAVDLPRHPGTLLGGETGSDHQGAVSPINRYASAVKDIASPLAKRMRSKFKWLAIFIIGAHIVATILASIAMGVAALHQYVMPILAVELLMLLVGMVMHKLLHHWEVPHQWAQARLLAEVARSVIAIENLHVYLRHLFLLPFPRNIRPVLRTMNVLHLQSTRRDRVPWQAKRDRYIVERFTSPTRGQIGYYGESSRKSHKALKILNRAFLICWTIAFGATALKLIFHHSLEEHPTLVGLIGTLAIVTPVLAAGSLSLAAALDLEAREYTYHEIHEFLKEQKYHLENASSERDYADLVLETEMQLLGETATWFSRRSFAAVT